MPNGQERGESGRRGRGPVVLAYWGRRGGGAIVTLALAERLWHEGEGPVSIVLSDAIEEKQLFLDAGVELRFVGVPRSLAGLARLGSFWRELGRLVAWLRAIRPRGVVFTMNFPFAWPLILWLQNAGLPVSYIVHDASPHLGDFARAWQRSTQAALVRRADRVVALSQHVADELARRDSRLAGKVAVLPLQAIFRPPAGAAARLRRDGPLRLLFIGRLIEYKGLPLLHEATMQLRGRADWTLTIAGSGPLAVDVATHFAASPQVHLELKWLDRSDFVDLIETHDVLLCPYVEASQSGVLAEGAAYGLPSIVLPNGALREQVIDGETGLVCDAPTASALAAAIRRLLDDRGLAERLAEGALDHARRMAEMPILPFLLAPEDGAAAPPSPDGQSGSKGARPR